MHFGKIFGGIFKAVTSILNIPGIDILANFLVPGSGQILMMANAALQAAKAVKNKGLKGLLATGAQMLLSKALTMNFPNAPDVVNRAKNVVDDVLKKNVNLKTALGKHLHELTNVLGQNVIDHIDEGVVRDLSKQILTNINQSGDHIDWKQAAKAVGVEDSKIRDMIADTIDTFLPQAQAQTPASRNSWVPPEDRPTAKPWADPDAKPNNEHLRGLPIGQ